MKKTGLHVFLSRNRTRRIKVLFRGDVRLGRHSQRGASSYLIAVIRRTFLGAYDPHRITRRHLGLGGLLPRIEGPVLEAVWSENEFSKDVYASFFFASASRPFSSKRKQKRAKGGDHACAAAHSCVRVGWVCV
jgi:hypothetical protein